MSGYITYACKTCSKSFFRNKEASKQKFCSIECRLFGNVNKTGHSQCWEWVGATLNTGYGVMNVNGKIILCHRISYVLANGFLDDKMFVCHSCDNPKCINPAHLFTGTQLDNMRDMARKDRSGRAKLKVSDAAVIRDRLKRGDKLKTLAVEYGVSIDAIRLIKNNKTFVDQAITPSGLKLK